MATKKKETPTVTRITASTSRSKTKKTVTPEKEGASKKAETPKKKVVTAEPITAKRSISPKSVLIIFRPFVAFGRYLKGSWQELKQVRWPTRAATWSLTGAVLLFTGFFVALILLLDAAFKYVFELILG